MTITVESAIPLDSTTQKEVEGVLSKHLGKNLSISYVVDPEILGGLRVYLGSKRIDVSLKGKLSKLSKLS